jgi:hypothetical protein
MEFFQGKVGEKWSYGYQHGYHVQTKVVKKGNCELQYATFKRNNGSIIEEIPQIELMKNDNLLFYKDLNIEGLHTDNNRNFQPVFVFQSNTFLPPISV